MDMQKPPHCQDNIVRSLSIILPCFNEEACIKRVLDDIIQKVERLNIPFETVVVDDGSSDRSMKIVQRMGQYDPRITLLRHNRNRGYGNALRSGFNAARNEWILLMDADGQFDARELEKFMPYARDFDIIAGFRENRADPWYRTVLTALSNKAISHLIFRVPLRDMSCGFKLFRRNAWHAAQPIVSTEQKLFIAEWLYNSIVANQRVKEIPVTHYPRTAGRAKGVRISTVFAMIKPMRKLLVAKYFSRGKTI